MNRNHEKNGFHHPFSKTMFDLDNQTIYGIILSITLIFAVFVASLIATSFDFKTLKHTKSKKTNKNHIAKGIKNKSGTSKPLKLSFVSIAPKPKKAEVIKSKAEKTKLKTKDQALHPKKIIAKKEIAKTLKIKNKKKSLVPAKTPKKPKLKTSDHSKSKQADNQKESQTMPTTNLPIALSYSNNKENTQSAHYSKKIYLSIVRELNKLAFPEEMKNIPGIVVVEIFYDDQSKPSWKIKTSSQNFYLNTMVKNSMSKIKFPPLTLFNLKTFKGQFNFSTKLSQ